MSDQGTSVICSLFSLSLPVLQAQVLPWYSYSVPGVLHLSMLTVSTGMALYCYFLCIAMDPGRYCRCCSVLLVLLVLLGTACTSLWRLCSL